MPGRITLPILPAARIGIVGSGFIAAGLLALLTTTPDLRPVKVLSRRHPTELNGLIGDLHTGSTDELIEASDVVVECSGDVHHAAEVIDKALRAGKPVVTMGTEFHVTVGSCFHGRGLLTEAEGDQPGSLAAFNEEILDMGFKPLVYGNIKGFLNHHPSAEEMSYWSDRQGISVPQVTSFTDGTKMQMEQAFIGNGVGAGLLTRGMVGPVGMDLREGAELLAARAKIDGRPVADYLLNHRLPAGVFIVAEHPGAPVEVMRYFKLGEGPYYTLLRPYHLCHLEMPRTIRRVLTGGGKLLDNGAHPALGVCAVTKATLDPGQRIERSIGGPWLRGEAFTLAEIPGAAPLGLLGGATLRRRVHSGDTVMLDDVDLPDTLAVRMWLAMRESSRARA